MDKISWQLQDAKNRFSEVVEKALVEGPQEITRRGRKTVVLLSINDFQKLKRRKSSLMDFFSHAPLQDLDLERQRDFPRNIDL